MLDRLLYWIKSIHRQSPKASILLIGTHRNSLQQSKLQAYLQTVQDWVDKLHIKLEITTVEINSDKLHQPNASQQELDELSGISAVRNKIAAMTKQLPGMNEKYPLVWLHMLLRMRDMVLDKELGVITKKGLNTANEHCNIIDPQEADDMLFFFHDTDKVFYFGNKTMLSTVVVLNPSSLLEDAAEITPTEKIQKCLANTQEGTAEYSAGCCCLSKGRCNVCCSEMTACCGKSVHHS